MAQAFAKGSKLRLFFETGLNEKGEAILKGKALNNINLAATHEELHQAAQAISSLCDYPLIMVERNDVTEITG